MNFVAFEFMIYIERVVRDFILPDNILVVKNRTILNMSHSIIVCKFWIRNDQSSNSAWISSHDLYH